MMEEQFIYPACYLGEYGLAIAKKKFLLKIVTVDSCFANFIQQNLPSGEDSYFLPFLKTFNREVETIPIVHKEALQKSGIISDPQNYPLFPTIAFCQSLGIFGVAFRSEPEFGSLLSNADPFFDLLHVDFEAPILDKNEMLFLPLQIMVKNDSFPKDVLQKVRSSELIIYDAPVLKKSREVSDITDKLNKVSFTPATVSAKKQFSSSFTAPESEGLTTVQTNSSLNSSAEFEKEICRSPDDAMEEDDPISEKLEIQEFYDPEEYSTLSEKEKERLRLLKKDKWPALKQNLGWRWIWVRGHIDAYQVPKCGFNKSEAIQNLDYFVDKDFYIHLRDNPFLVFEWFDLWAMLQNCGWTAISTVVNEKRQSHYMYATAKSHIDELLWGVHKFNSKVAMCQYIARFPYLLQDDPTFIQTLKRFQIKYDSKARKAFVDNKWITLADFRERCWVFPAKLFSNLSPASQQQNRILKSLTLNAEYAAKEDMEPSSPEIDGMTLAERDQVLKEIYDLAQKVQSSKWNLEKFHSLLLRVGWEWKEAEWSQKWWKWEKVYTPPYCSRVSEMRCGEDYFFAIQDVANFISLDRCRIIEKSGKGRIGKITNFDDSHYSLQKRVQQIAMNHDEKEAFTKFRLRDMLKDLGFIVFQEGNKWIYIPKMAVDEKINKDNYRNHCENEAYFVSEKKLLDFLTGKSEDVGNQSCPSSPGSVSSLSTSSLSPRPKSKGRPKKNSTIVDADSSIEKEVIPRVTKKKNPTNWISNPHPELLPTPEYQVHQAISDPQVTFGKLYVILKKYFDWDTRWIDNKVPIICTGSMIKSVASLVDTEHRGNGRSLDKLLLPSFTEDADYFYETDEGKRSLINYIKENGVRQTNISGENNLKKEASKRILKIHRSPVKQEALRSFEMLKKRSPMKPLYKAGDPSKHYDRLASDNILTPEAEEPEKAGDEMEYEDHASVDLFSNYFDNEEDYIPSFIPEEGAPLIPSQYRANVVDLLQSKPFNFERLFSQLMAFGWTWDYNHKSSVVEKQYFCPGIGKKSSNKKEGVNCFNNERDLLLFLKKMLHLPHDDTTIPSSSRQTRSGRELTINSRSEVATDVSCVSDGYFKATTKRKRLDTLDEESGLEDNSLLSIAKSANANEKENKPKRFRLQNQQPSLIPIETTTPLTLGSLINQALEGLQVFTDFNHALPFPLPERVDESRKVLHTILKAVRSGRGNFLYLFGNTGTGKSLTANSAASFAEDYIQRNSDGSYGNIHTFRFNASSVSKDSMLDVIRPALNLLNNEEFLKYINSMSALDLPRCDYELPEEPPSDADSTFSSSEKGSPVRRRGRPLQVRPMIVILVDEFDTAIPEVRAALMDWSLGNRESGCVVIGTGNLPTFLNGVTEYRSKSTPITFKAYDQEHLLSILSSKVQNLYAEIAKKFLISKMISTEKGKPFIKAAPPSSSTRICFILGSIRALFQNAKMILESAAKALTIEDLNGPPKEIVNMQKVKDQLSQSDIVLQKIDALSPPARNLLAILVLHGFSRTNAQFTMSKAVIVYNSSLEESENKLPKLEAATIHQALGNLVDSALLKLVQKKSSEEYRFSFEVSKLLQSTSLPEYLKSELRKYFDRENQMDIV